MTFLQIFIFIVAALLTAVVVALADVATHLNAIQWVLENTVTKAIENLEQPLQKLDEIHEDLNSLHSVIGGRLYQKDALNKDLDGPTIQELLEAIDKHLKTETPTQDKKPTLYKP